MRLRAAVLCFCLVAAPAFAQAPAAKQTTPDFAPFWAEFTAAVKAADKAKVRALTRFPFDYAGKKRDENGFEVVWKGLFTAKNRACLAKGKPVDDKVGGNHVIFCGEIGFYFEATPAGFRFTEIGAND